MAEAAISFSPCQPVPEHARQVMAWRNDPLTLAASRHHEPKQWEIFWPEFRDDYFRVEAALVPVFAVVDGHSIGFLRFLPADHPQVAGRRAVEISINLAPDWRGRGLGTAVLRAALAHLRTWGGDAVCAEVREDNIVSRRAFAAAGFREIGVAETHIADTGETCRMARFVYDLK